MKNICSLQRLIFGGLAFLGSWTLALVFLWIGYYDGLLYRSGLWSIGLPGTWRVDGPFAILALCATAIAGVVLISYVWATRRAVGETIRPLTTADTEHWPF